jgi:hypothetical protein
MAVGNFRRDCSSKETKSPIGAVDVHCRGSNFPPFLLAGNGVVSSSCIFNSGICIPHKEQTRSRIMAAVAVGGDFQAWVNTGQFPYPWSIALCRKFGCGRSLEQTLCIVNGSTTTIRISQCQQLLAHHHNSQSAVDAALAR